MQEEGRRFLVAMAWAVAAFFAYMFLLNTLWPAKPPATTQPAPPSAGAPVADAPPATVGSPTPSTAPTTAGSAGVAATGPAGAIVPALTQGRSTEPLTLGGRGGDALECELTPQGAAVASIRLISRDAKGRYLFRQRVDSNEPYQVVRPRPAGSRVYRSFETDRLMFVEPDSRAWQLDEMIWEVEQAAADRIHFVTTLRAPAATATAPGSPDGAAPAAASPDAGDLLRIRKTYVLSSGKPVFTLALTVENPSAVARTIKLSQNGPLGVAREDLQHDERLLIAARRNGGGIELGAAKQLVELQRGMARGEPAKLIPLDKGTFVWTALINKYFGVLMRPIVGNGDPSAFVSYAEGVAPELGLQTDAGDCLSRLWTAQQAVPPGTAITYAFEIYAGPRDQDLLAATSPAYADPSKTNYALLQSANRTCCTCTFQPLPEWMAGLLHGIYAIVRNFGVAIFILVLIVRTLLHPLAVWQQRSMFFMQESMARIQPKIQEIRDKYANDKVRQNQEMMRLFGEEHVNPAGNFVAFIPLFLQMPILVALWTAISSDIHLRHAPFDGWWIRDMSAPDALIRFSAPIDIPILSWLPFIGTIFTQIPSINLLPLLMGVSMYLQQKYMPKPAMAAKLDAAKNQPPRERKPGEGLTAEEMMRQQQITANMMCVMFPLMFYYMPSGLNLYWMASNVYGIVESLRIRKQIDREKQRRAALGPAAVTNQKKPGFISRWLKQMAEQAEEFQKKADEISDRDRRGRPQG